MINLEYCIHLDEALQTASDAGQLAERDRRIFAGIQHRAVSPKHLLMAWLDERKSMIESSRQQADASGLPGDIFSRWYRICLTVLAILGLLSGTVAAYSFLAYHGTHPVNVAIFMFGFLFLQGGFALLSLLFFFRNWLTSRQEQGTAVIEVVISTLFFSALPWLLGKIKADCAGKVQDAIDYTQALIQTDKACFRPIFFWLFYLAAAVFPLGFALGALAGTVFKVMVSDVAFGWQSTLVASGQKVHDIVSMVALPWSGFVPEPIAAPSLAHIEGSRIVLKDGIQTLATQDLASWWPFLCLGMVFYALIPRMVVTGLGFWSFRSHLNAFDFEKPRFMQIFMRMQSPDLAVDMVQDPEDSLERFVSAKTESRGPAAKVQTHAPGADAVGLASDRIYDTEAISAVSLWIQNQMFLNVTRWIPVEFDVTTDAAAISAVTQEIRQVVLVHEVWQPPIRGLLFYIQQVKALLPAGAVLWIVLTREAVSSKMGVDRQDVNFDIWKTAVAGLNDPGIAVKRFGES